jgi:hypothetical protein
MRSEARPSRQGAGPSESLGGCRSKLAATLPVCEILDAELFAYLLPAVCLLPRTGSARGTRRTRLRPGPRDSVVRPLQPFPAESHKLSLALEDYRLPVLDFRPVGTH